MDGPATPSPYLAGNYAPIRSEDDFDLEVTGEFPRELAGAFYRNGANPQFEPRDQYHWFAGDGMVHAFFAEEGKVRYRNRWVRTPRWLTENAAGRSLFGIFGNPITTDPEVLGEDAGVANTSIVWHGGRLMAMEEGHKPFEIDPASLDARGYVDPYGGKVTAHPKLDPETGELVWFGYMVGAMPFSRTLSYGLTDASGRVTRRDDFEAPFCSMIHDFLVTSRHTIFPILPLTGSLERVIKGGPPFAWEPDKGSHIGVLRRDAPVSEIRWFEADPCYVFHGMNAWEEGETIVAEVMEFPAAPFFPDADGQHGERVSARLVRWTIDLAGSSNRIRREPLDDLAGEFPRIDDRRAGLFYRHGWFAAQTTLRTDPSFEAIAHFDMKTGKRQTYVFAEGDFPGEPVFAPRSADAPEGDGWVMSVVYRSAEDRSDLVLFNAQDIAAGPIAAAKVPRRIPFGFHGTWKAAD
jgi:carotenoid cleavage dioxygenase